MTTQAPETFGPYIPGEFIREEMEARQWSVRDLAGVMFWPQRQTDALLLGQRRVTWTTAKDLARAFGTSVMYWQNLQAQYDVAALDGVR